MNEGVLQNTFLHLPRVGLKTEQKLWKRGFTSWHHYIDHCASCPVPRLDTGVSIERLTESIDALEDEDADYFTTLLAAGDAWRFYVEFREKTAFVDIETTGLYAGPHAITVIGLFDGTSTKVFIQGKNLEDFAEEVRKYSVLVTFNGKRFDLPFICSTFGRLPERQGHIDLLYTLRRLGYRGGLKSIERQVGLDREGALKDMDGYMAVLLWREYKRGNQAALDTLVRYNLEDVVNLQYLADMAYNQAAARLSIPATLLPEPVKYCVETPYDSELVEYLSDKIAEDRGQRWG